MSSPLRPTFGTLSDVKVVLVGQSIAAPFAAELMAENGADVTWIESPRCPDIMRSPTWSLAMQDRRNMRAMALDPTGAPGREALLRLLAHADILIESSRGGTWTHWGLDDDTLLAHNPRLVVVHVSGYGQSGDPEYVHRPSWDAIGQAFGGYANANGDPERPMLAKDFPCDYITALNVCWSALAGLHHARRTGEGEAIDVAQFEVLVRALGNEPVKYLNQGKLAQRSGDRDALLAGYRPIRCADGAYVVPSFNGRTAMQRGLPLLGLTWGVEIRDDQPLVPAGTPEGDLLEARLEKWCGERSADEAEAQLTAHGVSASKVMTVADMVDHPHYRARGVFTEWEDEEHGTVKGVGFVPTFTRHPQQIWRGAPRYGSDTADILAELGYSPAEIDELENTGVVSTYHPPLGPIPPVQPGTVSPCSG